MKAGKEKGYDTALGHMQKWVDRAEGLENIFAEGGLSRLWNNKVVFSTRRASHKDSPLKDRRNVFLHMLAYAEYFQSNVADIWRILNSLSNRLNELAKKVEAGEASPKESVEIITLMAKQTANKSHILKQTQKAFFGNYSTPLCPLAALLRCSNPHI